jgi:hypothetical protein
MNISGNASLKHQHSGKNMKSSKHVAIYKPDMAAVDQNTWNWVGDYEITEGGYYWSAVDEELASVVSINPLKKAGSYDVDTYSITWIGDLALDPSQQAKALSHIGYEATNGGIKRISGIGADAVVSGQEAYAALVDAAFRQGAVTGGRFEKISLPQLQAKNTTLREYVAEALGIEAPVFKFANKHGSVQLAWNGTMASLALTYKDRSYSTVFSNTGVDDAREFIGYMDNDYLLGRLIGGQRRETDLTASIKHMRSTISDMQRDGEISKELARKIRADIVSKMKDPETVNLSKKDILYSVTQDFIFSTHFDDFKPDTFEIMKDSALAIEIVKRVLSPARQAISDELALKAEAVETDAPAMGM